MAQFSDLNGDTPAYKRYYNVEMRACNETIDIIEKISKIHTKYSNLLYNHKTNMELKPLLDIKSLDKVYDPMQSQNMI